LASVQGKKGDLQTKVPDLNPEGSKLNKGDLQTKKPIMKIS
jgi:hypothetical protein